MATSRGEGGNMVLALSVALAAVLLIGAGNSPVLGQQEQLTVESRHLKNNNKELTDTINELEQMDKFFSELARPRFGRSEFKQAAASRGFGAEPQVPLPYRSSLIQLINNRLAQKYRDSLAY